MNVAYLLTEVLELRQRPGADPEAAPASAPARGFLPLLAESECAFEEAFVLGEWPAGLQCRPAAWPGRRRALQCAELAHQWAGRTQTPGWATTAHRCPPTRDPPVHAVLPPSLQRTACWT